jgi:hypothetical protein
LLGPLANLVLLHTSSLGVRSYQVERFVLDRNSSVIETTFGKVRVKKADIAGKTAKYKVEFDDCLRIAKETGLPLYQVMQKVNSEIGDKL